MTQVILRASFLGITIVGYELGANPLWAMFCIGPQNGQPLCPCAMRGVTVENGRYVQKIDHGPVSKSADHVDYLEAITNPRDQPSQGS